MHAFQASKTDWASFTWESLLAYLAVGTWRRKQHQRYHTTRNFILGLWLLYLIGLAGSVKAYILEGRSGFSVVKRLPIWALSSRSRHRFVHFLHCPHTYRYSSTLRWYSPLSDELREGFCWICFFCLCGTARCTPLFTSISSRFWRRVFLRMFIGLLARGWRSGCLRDFYVGYNNVSTMSIWCHSIESSKYQTTGPITIHLPFEFPSSSRDCHYMPISHAQ